VPYGCHDFAGVAAGGPQAGGNIELGVVVEGPGVEDLDALPDSILE
jgi:hypothetical protein